MIRFALLFFPTLLSAQLSILNNEPDGSPIIHYYPFYNGIQMVELDFLTAHQNRISYLEQAHPRALTWSMVLGPAQQNAYLFRDSLGNIVKQYGSADGVKILSVKQCEKQIHPHNSLVAILGSYIGFYAQQTRFYPYYLIGGMTSGLGLIDSFANIVLPQEYSNIFSHNNVFVTQKGEIFELRNERLELKYTTDKYQLFPSRSHEGFVDIVQEQKHGLIDLNGKMIVPCKYDFPIEHYNQYGISKVRREHRYGYIDSLGKEVIPCIYQSVGEWSEGLLDVRNDQKWGYIDPQGKTIIPFKYDIGIMFRDGLARVAVKKDWDYYFGYIDTKGIEVIPLQYSNAKDFEDGVAEVMLDGKWVKINKKGERGK